MTLTKKTLLATYTVKSSACSPTACAYTPTTKVTAGSYKWRARAGNSYGYSVYGDWLDFTVQLLPSTPTTLLQPAVNATIDLAQPQPEDFRAGFTVAHAGQEAAGYCQLVCRRGSARVGLQELRA